MSFYSPSPGLPINALDPVAVPSGSGYLPIYQSGGPKRVDLNQLTRYGNRPVPKKRMIQFGQVVNPAYVKANISTMEADMAVDGIVIHVEHTDPWYGTVKMCDRMFQGTALNFSDYATPLADLRETKFKRFTDNYIRINGMLPGKVDWFDERGMRIVQHNWEVAAWFARESGMRGWLLDLETTGAFVEAFQYPSQKLASTKTFAQYQAQVRTWGFVLGTNIQNRFPDIEIFLTLGYEQASQTQGADLTNERYGLYTAFLDGLYDSCFGATTITNLFELSYPYRTQAEYDYAREKQLNPPNCTSTRYALAARYGAASWLDNDSPNIGFNTSNDLLNYNTANGFKNNIIYGLNVADVFWIRNEAVRFYNLNGNPAVPQVYLTAMEDARDAVGIERKWNPSQLQSCGIWFDMDTLSAQSNGASISSFTETMTSNAATNTGTNRPTLDKNGLATGKAALRYTLANSQCLNAHALASLFNTSNANKAKTIALSFRQATNTPVVWSNWLSVGNSANAYPALNYGVTSTPRFFAQKINDANSSATTTSDSDANNPNLSTSSHVILIREESGNLEIWLDGTIFQAKKAFTKTGAQTFNLFRLGAVAGNVASLFLDGWIGDVVVCFDFLEQDECIRLMRYLGKKAGATVA